MKRRLIVNGDDFGQSAGINEGIIRCYEHGVLTSASLMVRWPHATAAADYARSHPALSVGLHLDFGEWIHRRGEWTMLYTVVPNQDADAVAAEVERQLDLFRRLMKREPTHLDSHQHVHASPPLDRIVAEHGAALGIPVRSQGESVRYEGAFYGQNEKGYPLHDTLTVRGLVEILRALPQGTTELGCHPGLGDDATGMYVAERGLEVQTLCDPRAREFLVAEDIQLVSFHDAAVNADVDEGMMKGHWQGWAGERHRMDPRAHTDEEFWALGEADADTILEDLAPPLGPGSRVLELGSGWGRVVKAMAHRFTEVWGVDISDASLERAARELATLPNVRLVQNNGVDLSGLPGDHFDLCYSLFMLDCLPSKDTARGYIEEAYRVLRHGGHFKAQVAGVYAGNPFRQLYADGANTWHGVRFTMSEIVRLLEEAGFEMASAYHAQSPQQLITIGTEDQSAHRQYRLWVVARKGSSMDTFEAVYYALGRELARLAPEGTTVVSPDKGMDVYLTEAGASGVTFLRFYLDDGETAVQALSRYRAEGARYVYFTSSSLWWLTNYPELAAHLETAATRLDTSPGFRLYQLT